MARRWTTAEENVYRAELVRLYVVENKTISDIGKILNLSGATVYDRLIRLQIPSCRQNKEHSDNRRSDVWTPTVHSHKLAELFGIMLGDGHISHFQMTVTLGTKEAAYARYVRLLIRKTFGGTPRITMSSRGHTTVYLGSTEITKWLKTEGLVQNKVAAQVGVPQWIFGDTKYMSGFLRGFFDTDGSVYRLRYGIQISLTNRSMPLLVSLQSMLRRLGYTPSAVSADRVYLTKVPDVQRVFREIRPMNPKHRCRYNLFTRRWRSSKRT